MSDERDVWDCIFDAAEYSDEAAIPAVIEALVTENAADLLYARLVNMGFAPPENYGPGCLMCDLREAMVKALKEGQ